MSINYSKMRSANSYRLIIDGYNLIFQVGLEGRSRNSVALDRARDRLISIVARHVTDRQRAGAAIVFDARSLPIKETHSVSRKNGVSIYFAVEYEDADSLIEELIVKNSHPKQLVVVSSDHRIQKAALRRKSTPIDSDVWYDQLESSKTNQSDSGNIPTTDQQEAISDRELEELKSVDWAAEFGLDEQGQTDREPAQDPPAFNPFPPGYTDDIEGS